MALRYVPTRGDVKNIGSSAECCTACLKPLVQVKYQARSADKPARLTTFCSTCPLDPRRLNPDGVKHCPDYGKGAPRVQRPAASTDICSLKPIASASRIVGTFSGAKANKPPIPDVSLGRISVQRADCYVKSENVDLRTCCLIQHGATVEQVEVSRRPLCPGVFPVQVLVCEVPLSSMHRQHYTIGSAEGCQHHGVTFDVRSQSLDHYEFSIQILEFTV
ncbi:hypothetical protein VP01_1858g1 [Puccinia sorghi]|uniref:Uncharacterized protein n=1 Tax=Puccinia sorghi TaxID=27349 RepID=A0A0L6VDK2_9BASI|nr:hypothetical protein VP01_1858g1 [Puccinia sorghi]